MTRADPDWVAPRPESRSFVSQGRSSSSTRADVHASEVRPGTESRLEASAIARPIWTTGASPHGSSATDIPLGRVNRSTDVTAGAAPASTGLAERADGVADAPAGQAPGARPRLVIAVAICASVIQRPARARVLSSVTRSKARSVVSTGEVLARRWMMSSFLERSSLSRNDSASAPAWRLVAWLLRQLSNAVSVSRLPVTANRSSIPDDHARGPPGHHGARGVEAGHLPGGAGEQIEIRHRIS